MSDGEPILIVDGDSAARTHCEQALQEVGYGSIVHAGSIVMANHLLEARGPFSVVILDIQLPDDSGLKLLEELSPLAPQTVVLVVTAARGLATAIDCLRRGAYDYVLKPIHPGDIQFTLARALTRRRRALAEIAEHHRFEDAVQARVTVLEQTRKALLRAICRLAEFRRPSRHVHPERVSTYACLLADELAMRSPYMAFITEEFKLNLAEAAMLHDIGKLVLPSSILLKAGRLTQEEMTIARSHTNLGREICLAVKEDIGKGDHGFVDMLIEVTGGHHERWDGKGYPNGLCEQDIPLSARIVALADFYDVLRTPVVYRTQVYPCAEIATMIREEAGCYFDPVVVNAFRRSAAAFCAIESRLSQQ